MFPDAQNCQGCQRRIVGMHNRGALATNIHLLAAVAALVAMPAAIASAADVTSEEPSPFIAARAHYDLVDAQGNVVGEVVSESTTRLRLRVLAVTHVQRAVPQTNVGPRTDGAFHPDYSRALTSAQMSAAWQAELDRLFPQPVTGGG